jgi:hypothetical protein
VKPTAELVDDDNSMGDGDARDQWRDSPVASASKYPVLAKFGIALAALVTMMFVAVIVLPMLLPARMTRGQVEGALGALLGLDVSIEGEHSVRVFPSVRLVADNVVAAPTGRVASFQIANLELEASALSLLSGSLYVSTLNIMQPNIQISSAMPSAERMIDPENVDRTWGWWRDFQLDNINVSGGIAMIASSGMTDDITITDIVLTDLPPAQDEAADGIAFDGTAIVNGQNIALHIAASNPQLLASGNRWPLTGILTSNLMSFGFDGSLAMRESLVGNGNLQFGSSDVAGLNEWLGTRIPHREASILSVISPFELTANTLELKVMKISAGATQADAIMKISGMASDQVVADVSINADMMDFGDQPMMMFHPAGGMMSLPNLAGTLRLDWRQAIWGVNPMGPGNVIASRTVESGAVNVKLEKALALNGIIRGDLTIDRSEGMRAMHIDGTAVGVSFEDLTSQSESLSSPLVTGAASIDLNMFSVGADIGQMFEALSGSARLQVQDGKLTMPELVQVLNQDAEASANNSIDFSTLNGTFRVAQGIATSEDLLLRADDLSLVAHGSVDMADWTIDLDIGQLKGGEGGRSLRQYRLSGPVGAVEFEAIN